MDFLINYNSVNDLSDDRTKGWPMVDTVWHVLAAIAVYNIIIQLTAKYMKNRNPYKLRNISLIYNITVALLNLYVVVQMCICAKGLNYNLFCNEGTRNNRHPLEMKMISTGLLLYMSKYLELIDTLFIVLKKKEKNLSFLHLYHHSSILFFSWIMTKWFPTGNTFIPIVINSTIHVVMYSYYALSCLGPKVAKYLWWKKYLTILQLIQFAYGTFLMFTTFFMNCNFYPNWYIVLQALYVISFLILFGHFYYETYLKSKKDKNV